MLSRTPLCAGFAARCSYRIVHAARPLCARCLWIMRAVHVHRASTSRLALSRSCRLSPRVFIVWFAFCCALLRARASRKKKKKKKGCCCICCARHHHRRARIAHLAWFIASLPLKRAHLSSTLRASWFAVASCALRRALRALDRIPRAHIARSKHRAGLRAASLNARIARFVCARHIFAYRARALRLLARTLGTHIILRLLPASCCALVARVA